VSLRFFDRQAGLRDRLRRQLKHRRLVVCLSHGDHQLYLGGVQLYMRVEQRSLNSRAVSYVNLWPAENGTIAVSCDGARLGAFAVSEIAAACSALASDGFTTAAAIVHHVKGWPLESVVPLLTAIAAPITRFFLHDYHTICANPNLTFGDMAFCNAPPPDSQACTICRHGPARRAQLPLMKDLIDYLAERGASFIAPSDAAAQIWIRAYPAQQSRVRVLPHQQLIATAETVPSRRRRPRLGFVGNGNRTKGVSEWVDLIETPAIRQRYRLYHFGECTVGCPVQHVNASFIKDGKDAMLQTLRRHELDFAFLWSIWPETFSFTCCEAIAAGSFVITNEVSGNIAALVKRTGRGRVFADLAAARRFLVDDAAVAAARASLAGAARLLPVWSETLISEIV
jgi:hypothetical protein